MHIVMYCPGMPFHGGTLLEGKSLGGSESAAYYMARSLSELGHQVTLFTTIDREQQGIWDNVRYLSCGPRTQENPLGTDFEWYASATPHDVCILQRVPDGFRRSFASKVNLWWAHDLALHRHAQAFAYQLWNVDRVLAVSHHHARQMAQVYNLPDRALEVVPNGLDLSLFSAVAKEGEAGTLESKQKIKNGLLTYTSRPERGLETLVKPGGVMELLLQEAPGLRLQVAGYENTTSAMAPYYQYLWKRCEALPNVDLLGPLSKEELAGVLRSAWLHVYPTDFEEVSCITAMETQAAGTPILTTDKGALPETLANAGVVWINSDEAQNPMKIVEEILSLQNNPELWETLRIQALQVAEQFDWRASAEKVAQIAEEVLLAKSDEPARLSRHLLHYSDIVACQKLLDQPNCSGDSRLAHVKAELAGDYHFVASGDYKSHYEAFAQWQKKQNIDQGHNAPERLLAMPRFRIVADLVAELPLGARVLDYGCGQGHFTTALAARHPGLQFTGVDLSAESIAQGLQRIKHRNLANLKLISGEADELKGEFDLILAMEVLEHVPEPWKLAELLESNIVPGGSLCITVPFGPWEEESYATVPFRSHIHHLERADLSTMFGHKSDYRVVSIPVRTNIRGEPLGCYRVTYTQGGEPPRPMDLEAKLSRQAPRETLAVCMICRDDGTSLARTLESVQSIADQIVIGIDGDPGQLGPAWEVARRYGAETFQITSPLETGFDVARNQTLEKAWTDWVLWIDDDEVLEWPQRLVKYLRANPYDAYAIKQHHFAVEPAGVLKTDYPCRLFRNHCDVQFFGVVHEHPERGLNEGIGNVLLLPDVAISHNGYDTEEIRRERFKRNLPLMVRDRELNPDRVLGKFLWVRDLAHLNRYAMEQGQAPSSLLETRAKEAVYLWRELLSQGHVRLALDALPYYSDSVTVLQGEGIQFELAMGAARSGLGDLDRSPPQKVRGQFLDTADIKLLTEKMMEEKTTIFEGKYL